MATTTTGDRRSDNVAPTEAPRRDERLRRLLAVIAGPALIIVAVLFAMRGFAFGSALTHQHPDILTMWLPRFCFLGDNLAAGHVPLWNPFQFTGAPYVADAQSGWLYLPPSVLFTVLPNCGDALRLFIVFNPLLAGLGLYWFLRKEELHRAAATAGGLSYALVMAASSVAISLPFAGTLAWTPLVLVGASGWMRAETWPRRLGWLALGALAWSQVSAAHMSHGLLMCSWLTFAYLAARAARAVHYKHERPLRPILMGLGYLAFLPLASLALLLPHLAIVDRTSLRGGYDSLGVQLADAGGANESPLLNGGVWSGWIFALGSSPGAFAGATILTAVPLAARTYGRRYLAVAFGATAVIAWLLTLNFFVSAQWFNDLVLRLPFGDVYLHNPGRFRYLLFITLPVLGALGVQGLIERPLAMRRALTWIAAGAGFFLVLPIVLGAHPERFLLFGAALIPAAVGLAALGARKRWAFVAVPLILAVELTAGAIWSQVYEGGTVLLGLESAKQDNLIAGPLRWPDVPIDGYLEPGTLARRLQREGTDRYYTWAPPAAYYEKGYLFTQEERDWPGLENARGMLFEIPDSMGYSPIQLARYWSFIRATNRLPVFYNASVLQDPSLADMRLLGAQWMLTPARVQPQLPATLVASEEGWKLWLIQATQDRASVVPHWTVVDDPAEALERVAQDDFNPEEEALLEEDPGIEPTAGAWPGLATYDEVRPEDVRVLATAEVPSLVLVRNAWDPGWSATVDGEPAPVLRADYLLQAVPIPEGEHEVRLTYREPWVGRGLLISGIVWGLFLVALIVAIAGRRRRLRAGRAAA